MTTITKADQERLWNHNFRDLPKKQKKVFSSIQYLCRKYGGVTDAAAETIARNSGVSRRTVFRALKVFEERDMGICRLNRPYRSNKYYMDDKIIAKDLRKNETFIDPEFHEKYRENGTQFGTVYSNSFSSSYKSDITHVDRTSQKVEQVRPRYVASISKQEEKQFQDIVAKYSPKHAGKFLPKDVEKLVFQFMRHKPLSILIMAVEDLRSSKAEIHNLAAWLTSRCKQYVLDWQKSKERGISPPK